MERSEVLSTAQRCTAGSEEDVRPTGPGVLCWCGCNEAIPAGMRTTARFVPGHKDGFHNHKRAIRLDQSDVVGAELPSPEHPALSLAHAAAAAVQALADLGQLAEAAADEVHRARRDAVDAKVELAETLKEVGRLRAQVHDLTVQPSLKEADEYDVTAGVVRGATPNRPGSSEETKTIARAFMVAVRAERARALAAETQTAALLAQLTKTLDRLIDVRAAGAPTAVLAAPPDRIADRPGSITAVPSRLQSPQRWSVTVPVTPRTGAVEFGGVDRLGNDGPLTADEAVSLVTATAMAVTRTVGPIRELPEILTGTVWPDGLATEANLAVDAHLRTLDRLGREGLGDLVDPIVEGALACCNSDGLDDDPT